MKPKTAPKNAKWQNWPTLEQVQERYPDLKLHQLRDRLAKLPCYRCSDNTVRYPIDRVLTALDAEREEASGSGGGEDELGGIDEKNVPEPKQFNTLMLLRECMRQLQDVREEKNRTITLMETPLRIGVQMMQDAAAVTSRRLDALENQWDKLIRTTEELVSMHAEREAAAKKQEASIVMRSRAGEAFFQQLPKMVSTWGLNQQATMALDLIGSFKPEMVDAFVASGTMTADQTSALKQLRAYLVAKEKAAPKGEPATNHNSHRAAS